MCGVFAVSAEAFAGVEGRTWANDDDKYLPANSCSEILCKLTVVLLAATVGFSQLPTGQYIIS